MVIGDRHFLDSSLNPRARARAHTKCASGWRGRSEWTVKVEFIHFFFFFVAFFYAEAVLLCAVCLWSRSLSARHHSTVVAVHVVVCGMWSSENGQLVCVYYIILYIIRHLCYYTRMLQ